jgi:hypothetical protein
MNNNKKVLLAALLLFSCVTAAIAWVDPKPSFTVWQLRGWSTAISLLSVALLVWAMRRPDRAPDFLRQLGMPAFEMKGLRFSIVPDQIEDRWRLNVFFQNRYDRPCRGHVVVRTSKGFWMNRPDARTFVFAVDCEGGGFARAAMEVGVPVALQGQKQSFDVAAKIEYPNGRGRMLRFRDGLAVGKAGGDAFRIGLTVAAAATGSIVLSKPAQFKIVFPRGVRDVIETSEVTYESLWRPGDADSSQTAHSTGI